MKQTQRSREIGLHAVDLGFVREQLVPWVLGEIDGDLPRIDAMARCLHTRYQANVVGRALVRLESDRAKERARANRKPNLRERLFSRASDQARSVESLEQLEEPDGFGALAARSVLERPFLIAGKRLENQEEATRSLVEYLNVRSDEEVISIIEINLDRMQLDPETRRQALAAFPGNEYEDRAARDYAESPLASIRRSLKGHALRLTEEPHPRDIKVEGILTELIRAAAHYECSWLLQGVSPSIILESSGVHFLDLQDAFCFASGLLGILPWLAWDIQQVLEHPGIGAVIEAEQVAEFRACLQRNRERIRPVCADREWQLLDECLATAAAKGLDVVESSGIIRTQEGCLP